ncbi:FAD-dependent oxidoreductase [Acholeplasma granularum]|uniref:FAD-dependent oxidoreductase n=1 Tax=Acholeplasma granularum TaxID=264635 RepID=UPI0004702B78|nr:FAD-dependent oxidoreductase [Acholeplasma granularum]
MKLVVIGAVAAGTSAAAKARRNDEDANIVIYEKDFDISYSGCGMPYFLGGMIDDANLLTPRDPKYFKDKYNIDIYVGHEVLEVYTKDKTLKVKNLNTGDEFLDTYDKLIFATGASAFLPKIEGNNLPHVFSLRNIKNMHQIHNYIQSNNVKSVSVVGSGFIGLELTENFREIGLDVVVIEKNSQVSPGLDSDMASHVEKELLKNGVRVLKNSEVTKINENEIIVNNHSKIESQMVILATGVKPNVNLALKAGVKTGDLGGILVDEKMQTNLDDIYACGDCIEHYHLLLNKNVYRPLGSTANKTGRIAGHNASGGNMTFKGVLGTSIYKIFDLSVAQTGLTEKDAINEKYDFIVSHNIKPNKPEYFGGKEMVIKAIADKNTGRILGAQIIGYEGVDKRIDVFVTAITLGATAENLVDLDLAYAPPFATTKDPVMYTGMILTNALKHERKQLTPSEVLKIIESNNNYTIIDTRVPKQYEAGHIKNAINIPHQELRDKLHTLDKESIIITYCNKGVTGNATQNILINHNFKNVYSIAGGYKTFKNFIENKK